MRCPSCHQNIRIQGKFCPKCGEQIFGLPVRPETAAESAPPPAAALPPPIYTAPPPPAPFAPPAPVPSSLVLDDFTPADEFPAAPPSGPVLDISFDDGPPSASGSSAASGTPAGAVGKVCPYCRFPIKAGEAVQICPSCGEPHHLDCWQENGGCTVYGCRSSPAMAAVTGPVAGPQPTEVSWPPSGSLSAPGPAYGSYQAPSLPPQAVALLEAELNRLAVNALAFAFLGLILGIPALIGLLTALSVLGQIARSRLPARQARGKAWAAVVVSTFFLVAWAAILIAAAGSK